MDSNTIRERFVRFFASHGHLQETSSSLVVQGDPSVLLTSAGMQQFKPFYLDPSRAPTRRVVTIQKCMRTSDIEEVGDATHHTFFEMLGNFAFGASAGGGYFKREAIVYAYAFVTKELGLDIERVWATTWSGEPGIPADDEAVQLWQEAGMPVTRIRGLNRKPDGSRENFWGPTGDSGPCGPCSELHVDMLGACPLGATEAECGPGHECGRFVEIWNLVFNQFYQDVDKSLRPLEHTGIDTGLGIERIAAIMQGVTSAYETDLFRPIIAGAEGLLDVVYGSSPEIDRALRIIADHIRSVTFMIADGVFPSNEARGYVARRLLRRAVRYGRLLGQTAPFLEELVEITITRFGSLYPNLRERAATIRQVVRQEEVRFSETLAAGTDLLDLELARLPLGTPLSGATAFRLYDTYGFPLELTREVASARGVSIDEEEFDTELEAGRTRSRASHRFTKLAEIDLPTIVTTFDGYTRLETVSARVVAVLVDGVRVPAATLDLDSSVDNVWVVLDRTPFYAERGGQIGDRGAIIGPHGRFVVAFAQAPQGGEVVVHVGQVGEGMIAEGDTVDAMVDPVARAGTMAHHTATHLLHASLRMVLGDHVHQAGSLVAPDRLRFDFAHGLPLTSIERRMVQDRVNRAIQADLPVHVVEMATADAVQLGATALFDEKYGDRARVVTIPSPLPLLSADLPISAVGEVLSRELCGGTHTARTGAVGPFVIVAEGSTGSGIRRIEALAGASATAYLDQQVAIIEEVSVRLGVPSSEIPTRIEGMFTELADVRRALETSERRVAHGALASVVQGAISVQTAHLPEVRVVVTEVDPMIAPTFDRLREASDWIRDKLGVPAIIILASTHDERVQITASVSRELTSLVAAHRVMGEIVAVLGGRGGGRPEMAQGGGGDPAKLADALARGQTYAVDGIRLRS